MGILDATGTPFIVIIILFGILFGFFRHLLGKVVGVLLVEVALFVLFPNLLVQLAQLVAMVRGAIS